MEKRIVTIFVILGLLLPSFSFAQEVNQLPKAPETLGEAKTIGEKILKGLPEALKGPWQEALRIWQKMADIWSNWWNSYIFPWLQNIWQNILSLFGKEVEKRKPIIEEEFKKEKEEMKEEVPEVTKSLWERFKELIK